MDTHKVIINLLDEVYKAMIELKEEKYQAASDRLFAVVRGIDALAKIKSLETKP